tara:strand:+ start:124 stop:726 length:603 start_codon:yes stop_codon:yes gene_type:complete
MQKKIFLQIGLFFVALIITLITFNKYFDKSVKKLSTDSQNTSKQKINNENTNNIIKNIYYISNDNADNVYEIMSDLGEIDINNPSIILMTDVTAKISFVNSEPIIITSKYAKYNNENYETIFNENISVNYENHNIRAEGMTLSMEENLAILNKDIFYNNSDIELIADRVEIDLMTKESKIFMDNSHKKVQITGKDKNGNY